MRRSGGDRGADRVLTLAATSFLLAGVLPQYLIASLALSIREDFAFGNTQIGLATAVSFAASAVVSPLAGRAIDRIGVRRGIVLAVWLTGGSSLATATVAGSAAAIVVLMAVNGAGIGIGSPTLSALLAGRIQLERQGTAFGMLTAAPQMAAFAAGLTLPTIAEPLSWRVAFALPVLVSLGCLALLVRGGDLARAPAPGPRRAGRARGVGAIHVIGLAAACMSAGGVGMRSFLVVFGVSVGLGSAAAALLLSATGLAAVVSRIGLGVLGDRRPGDHLARAGALMLVSAGGFALMAAELPSLVIVGAMLAGGIGWGWQSPLSLAVIVGSPHDTAAAVGVQMSGYFAGALVGPLLVALLATHGSFRGAWLLCCGLALGAGALALLVRRWWPSVAAPRPAGAPGGGGV
jgi:MFS family permease